MPRALLLLMFLSACASETLSRYAGEAESYRLMEIDGTPFAARATISFPAPGRVAGQAPCNSYSGKLTAPYPWFATGQLTATQAACAELDAERAFFAALGEMTLAEAGGATLILSNGEGREMLFSAAP